VLSELGLVSLQAEPLAVAVPAAATRTELERSPAFRAYTARLGAGLEYLDQQRQTSEPSVAVAAAA
jgi:hypothetical protein